MKLMKQRVLLLFTLVMLFACSERHSHVTRISTKGSEAVDPYLTNDNNGNVVLCWTERDPRDSMYRLKYAVYDKGIEAFGATVTVQQSAGTRSSGESMNKVAFKSDGTVIAVFGKRFENERNPYAGALYYTMSADKGKTWAMPQFLHSDTSHAYGRGFFDLAPLKNGEVAAVWLDGRFGKKITGSALFFAATERDAGFGKERCVAKGTCECCRTDIQTDDRGDIHIAYRNIMFPGALLGKQVRDMSYLLSSDNGKTFSPAKTISTDNWAIEGCPHTGPTLAVDGRGVHAAWFTAGGNSGLYYSTLTRNAVAFEPRKGLTMSGRHPQMIAIGGNRQVVVWETPTDKNPTAGNAHTHGRSVHEDAPALTSIVGTVIKNGQKEKIITISEGSFAEHHPVVISMGKKVLVAWVREENGVPGISFTTLDPLE